MATAFVWVRKEFQNTQISVALLDSN